MIASPYQPLPPIVVVANLNQCVARITRVSLSGFDLPPTLRGIVAFASSHLSTIPMRNMNLDHAIPAHQEPISLIAARRRMVLEIAPTQRTWHFIRCFIGHLHTLPEIVIKKHLTPDAITTGMTAFLSTVITEATFLV